METISTCLLDLVDACKASDRNAIEEQTQECWDLLKGVKESRRVSCLMSEPLPPEAREKVREWVKKEKNGGGCIKAEWFARGAEERSEMLDEVVFLTYNEPERKLIDLAMKRIKNLKEEGSIWWLERDTPFGKEEATQQNTYLDEMKEVTLKLVPNNKVAQSADFFEWPVDKKVINMLNEWWAVVQTGEVLPLVEHTTPKGKWWATLRCLIPPPPNPYLGGDPNRKEGPVKKTRRRSRTYKRKKKPKGKSKRKKEKKKMSGTKKRKINEQN